ncbi:hypothetical protein KR074_011954 [Drosophila pseudoananassae]|nr:hypothetical protein KR074_011954 [Drosophila pseudoananassae]
MRVVRLNFSHGSHELHCRVIQAARKAMAMYVQETGIPTTVAIALDTSGPEIRTGQLADGSPTSVVLLKRGDKVTLTTNKSVENQCTKEKIYVDYKSLPSVVKPGRRIFIDDGLIGLRVENTTNDEVVCTVLNDANLGSHKGVNLPGTEVPDLPAVTERDKKDLKFGVEQKVDMIFASFIRDANAVSEIRQTLGPKGEGIKIISKIESQEGVNNIDEIIKASDGIMVARGDMGIELFTEDVPLAQKSIIAKCNMAGKPVICATQMLESMLSNPRPTRAEASDVANAVFDGADTVMLSGETAKGKYPVEAVQCMARICAKTEAVLWYENMQDNLKHVIRDTAADQISAVTTAIVEAAMVSQAKIIVVACPCGMVGHMISQMRPNCPIVALTGSHIEGAQSMIYRGIYPLLIEEMALGCMDFRRIVRTGLKIVARMHILEAGKKASVVLVNAMSANNISFRLFTIKQPSEKEMQQRDRCRRLALAKTCKRKSPCKVFKEKDNNTKNKCKSETDNCKKLLEEQKENSQDKRCEAMAQLEKCKQLSQKNKCQPEVKFDCCEAQKEDKCVSAQALEEKKKQREMEIKLIQEAIAQLEAAEKAKQCEQAKKEQQDLENCRKLAEKEKKEEEEIKCKQKQKEKKRAKMAKKWKRLSAKRKKKRQAELCKQMADDLKRKEAEATDKIMKAVCKKLAEMQKNPNNDNSNKK